MDRINLNFNSGIGTILGEAIPLTLVLVVWLFTISTTANAESIFGIGIGKPFAVPKCSNSGHGSVCYDKDPIVSNWGSHYTLNIPYESMTFAIRKFGFHVTTYNDEVTNIGIVTYGEQSQELVFQELKSKFGKPKSVKINNLQNGYGAKFKGINATWDTRCCKVVFEGIDEELDYGTINIHAKTQNSLESNKIRLDALENRRKSPKF